MREKLTEQDKEYVPICITDAGRPSNVHGVFRARMHIANGTVEGLPFLERMECWWEMKEAMDRIDFVDVTRPKPPKFSWQGIK